MPQKVIGCDLARATIDIHVWPSGEACSIPNSPDDLGVWADEIDKNTIVVFEATSGCDGPLMAVLAGRNVPFSWVNPRQGREIARATGVLAKTDRVDARVPAEMGHRLSLPVTVPAEPTRARLADLVRRRKQLVNTRNFAVLKPRIVISSIMVWRSELAD